MRDLCNVWWTDEVFIVLKVRSLYGSSHVGSLFGICCFDLYGHVVLTDHTLRKDGSHFGCVVLTRLIGASPWL